MLLFSFLIYTSATKSYSGLLHERFEDVTGSLYKRGLIIDALQIKELKVWRSLHSLVCGWHTEKDRTHIYCHLCEFAVTLLYQGLHVRETIKV